MKNLISLIVFIAFSSCSYSQSLTVHELIKQTNCLDFECFNDFITHKGFSFEENKKDGVTTSYSYSGDEKYETQGVKTNDVSIYTKTKGQSISIAYRTADKERYHKLLSELKSLGFKGGESNKSGNGTLIYYTSDSFKGYKFGILVEKIYKGKLSWTSYYIEVIKII